MVHTPPLARTEPPARRSSPPRSIMHVPTYLLAQNVHGPCFTSPRFGEVRVSNVRYSVFAVVIFSQFLHTVKSSCYGEVSSPLAYFTNPTYPDTDYLPNYCTYTIKVRIRVCLRFCGWYLKFLRKYSFAPFL